MQAKPCELRRTNNSHQEESLADTRKRKRSDEDDPVPDDDRSKPRRVNPHHLAARLGPDLVREMEEHIKPGAYMPSFAIRKDLQERYQVDRRHLYDYFHSRGLRVAKEERFNNLARSRQKKAQDKANLKENEAPSKNQTPKRQKRQPLSQELENSVPTIPRPPPVVSHKCLTSPASILVTSNLDSASPKHFIHSLIQERSPDETTAASSMSPPVFYQHQTRQAESLTSHALPLSYDYSPVCEELPIFMSYRDTLITPSSPSLPFVSDLVEPIAQDLNNDFPTTALVGNDTVTQMEEDIDSEVSSPPSSPYDPLQDPENPYQYFQDINSDDFLLDEVDSTPYIDIFSTEHGPLDAVARSRLYNLISRATLQQASSMESLGSYQSYMAQRKNSYYNALLSVYEDIPFPDLKPALISKDNFDDFSSWLVDEEADSRIMQIREVVTPVNSQMTVPHDLHACIHAPSYFLPVDVSHSYYRDIYSSRVPSNVTPLQWVTPHIPLTHLFELQKQRIRRCSLTSKGSTRRRSISAGGM